MKGIVAVTDREWFEFLSRQNDLDEVNFWRPRDTQTPRIEPGTPFLFKLKKGHGDRIVGFGVFARHSVLPVWMAWEAFGSANGSDSLVAMRGRIERLRRVNGERSSSGDYPIGCSGKTEVVAKAARRRFSAAEKLRVLREADGCTKPGELSALLRREGCTPRTCRLGVRRAAPG